MTLFRVIREKSLIQENKRVVTYGIKAYRNTKEAEYVANVSTSFLFVLRLCMKFTVHRLSPMHLKDVLSDMLLKVH